ncbi:MAG: tetratricopeptide repeat protein [Burkholderiaceae bacterium]|nr:tetratricopeptide repeat protein [Burkholderiaceae bacterium]
MNSDIRLEQARALLQAGRREEASALCGALLRDEPHHAGALHLAGLIAYESGNETHALALIKSAAAAAPQHPAILTDLGGLLTRAGKLEDAAACFERVLAQDRHNAAALFNLGCTRQAQRQFEAALENYRAALNLSSSKVDVLCNIGACLQELSRPGEAAACYREAIALQPGDFKLFNNLGVALQANGEAGEARKAFAESLAIDPASVRAHINIAMACYELGEFDEAVTMLQRALALDPAMPEAYFSLGVVQHALCRHEDAVACYRRAIELRPDYLAAHHNLLMTMLFVQDTPPEAVLAAHRHFGEIFESPLKALWPRHRNERIPNKRLKIGYVSGDLRIHAVAYFIEPAIARRDGSRFEVYCYSNCRRRDFFTERLIAEADHWRECAHLDDAAMAAQIEADGIDILVDLSGHTAHNRLMVFARKPAPVQMTYLGYPGTSGLTAMDYRITDGLTEPEGQDYPYVETLLRLPESVWCYRPSEDMSGAIPPLPALSKGYLTFGSFNNINKIGDDCIILWAHLLRSVPTAHLLMVTVPEGEVRDKLHRSFAELGVANERVHFEGKLPPLEFKQRLQTVDITLDPYPINGATTTCESLWQGVPVLAVVGTRFLSRAGLSVLSAARMADFAAPSVEDFVKTAILLSNNLPLLANIRAGLREHLANTPLLDQDGFARSLEALYREAWGNWCAQPATE